MSFLKQFGTSRSVKSTESDVMNHEAKVLDDTKVYITELSRKMRQTMKTIESLVECSQQLSETFHQFSSLTMSLNTEHPLGEAVSKCRAFETHFNGLLFSLVNSVNIQVLDPLDHVVKDEIPNAQVLKKKFDGTRRDYDNSINRLQVLVKEKKPNPPRIQQGEVERDRMKDLYETKGDETYCALRDVNEHSQFELLEKILSYCENINQFFIDGAFLFKDFRDVEIVKYRKWIAEEKERHELRRVGRVRREWSPDYISGDSPMKMKVFGLPYDEIMERDNPVKGIPMFISKAFLAIKKSGLTVQGIMRTSPPKADLEALKNKIDQGEKVHYKEIEDVHLHAGIIKLFLKELPNPLMTFDLFKKFVQVSSLEGDEIKMEELKKVLHELPKHNHVLLKKLMNLMSLIEKNKDINKMTSLNLAAVICPLILYAQEPDIVTMVDDIEKSKDIIVFMISHYSKIFKLEEGESSKKKSGKKSNSKGIGLSPDGKKKVKKPKNKTKEPKHHDNHDHDHDTDQVKDVEVEKENITVQVPDATSTPIVDKPNDIPPNNILVSDGETTNSHPDVQIETKTSPVLETNMTHSSPETKVDEAESERKDSIDSEEKFLQSLHLRKGSILQRPSISSSVDMPSNQIQFLLSQCDPVSVEHYFNLYPMLDSSFLFSKFVVSPTLHNEMDRVNEALKSAAKDIRDTLRSLTEVSETLSTPLKNRMSQVATHVQKRILNVATTLRGYTPEVRPQLIKAILDFVKGIKLMHDRVQELTQEDYFTFIYQKVYESCDHLSEALRTSSPQTSLFSELVVNSILMMNALMQSLLVETKDLSVIAEIEKTLSASEQVAIDLNNILMTSIHDNSFYTQVQTCLEVIKSHLVVIEGLLSKKTISHILYKNHIVLRACMDKIDEEVNIMASSQSDNVKKMQELYKSIKTSIDDVYNEKEHVVIHFTHIQQSMDQLVILMDKEMKVNVTNDTIMLLFEWYSHMLKHFRMTFQMASMMRSFEMGQGVDPMVVVKDFVYMMWPFVNMVSNQGAYI